MLIRLCSHYKDNANHVDKLINIEGLPEEWLFRKKDGKNFLKTPWEFDITNNIPLDIRMHFQDEPMKIWTEFPAEKTPGIQDPNQPKWIVDEHDVYGLRIDYQTGPGQAMWEQVEELLDRETPRHLKIPKPAMVGDMRIWTLTADKVPSVTLSGAKKERELIEPPPAQVEIRPDDHICKDCNEIFQKPRALWMHRRRAHKVSEPLKAGATA